METVFEFVNIDKSENLEAFTEKKLEKLENKYDWIVRANIYFKHDENQKPNGYITEVRLSAPGPEIFAQSNENSYEASIAETVRDLDRQCEKRKAKMSSH
ncbi:HPF/RaiA family ribosome-associated protein [Christiangramia marina]|jgi:putative sigma-54 modulation protein|uniref:HPF/RaiA family ribosome-associated protein n=1 Tax=Christiangramia TaxID=292691 RepID=UPI000403BE1B|nr:MULTISPECIES: HPF/RaiA family ribosome-associated protein [Christiangramia]WPY97148.1 HPF/RaiA family ribosome-associated protein [Christiangramia sp. OXR-203]|tara:strand:- start:51 stop:350 length:300 start_codon:yes stop_codon:yes gene_type:complete